MRGVLDDLTAAIDGLKLPYDGESLTQAIALRDRLDARIAEAVAAFDTSGWWAADGSVSTVAWLRGTPE